ncbi:MAG: hypothetical protein SOW79_08340 [Prevotella sp.]|nr:hypothetical protein [Prevotella sp.]
MNKRNKVIELMAQHERMSISQIAQAIGKPATNLYDIQKGKLNGVSEKLADLILSQFPHYNKTWLMTGEGEMLAPSMQAGDGSVQVAGNASNVNAGKTIDKLVELLKKKDEQIDRLISLLEKKIE